MAVTSHHGRNTHDTGASGRDIGSVSPQCQWLEDLSLRANDNILLTIHRDNFHCLRKCLWLFFCIDVTKLYNEQVADSVLRGCVCRTVTRKLLLMMQCNCRGLMLTLWG